VFAKIKPYFIGFVSGIVLCGIITLWISSGTADRLAADLRAAKWSLESAIRTIDQSAEIIQGLQSELAVSGKLTTDQQSIIDGQQSIIDDQKQIIDGIIDTIGGQGSIIGEELRGIAQDYRRLYNSYH
jgi:hypothetical protein